MENLRQIRKAKGLTMKELGKAVDVSESMIQMVESGTRKPSYELLLKLGEALDCSVDTLINDKKIPATNSDGMKNDYKDFMDILEQLHPENAALLKEQALLLLKHQKSQDDQ